MVDRAHAGRDLGGRILRCAEELARVAGARYLWLDAATDVEPLQRWNEQRGYNAVGSRVFTVGPEPTQLRPATLVDGLLLRRVDDPLGEAAALRGLHDRIARPHHWSSLAWSDERWRSWLHGEGQRHWFIEDAGRRLGRASLQAHEHGDVEIDNLGLVPEALGAGRGGAALTMLTRQVWSFADELRRQQPHEQPGRVFLHTSSWAPRSPGELPRTWLPALPLHRTPPAGTPRPDGPWNQGVTAVMHCSGEFSRGIDLAHRQDMLPP